MGSLVSGLFFFIKGGDLMGILGNCLLLFMFGSIHVGEGQL